MPSGSSGRASVRFHETVCEASGMKTLALCVRQFDFVIHQLTDLVEERGKIEGRSGNMRAHRAHVRFVQMLQTSTGPQVEKYWRKHVEEIGEQLLRGRLGARVVDLFAER